MTPRAKMLIRRVGGLALVILGALVLVGPVGFVVWTSRMYTVGVGPKVLSDLAYTVSLGLMLVIMGLYFLTRRTMKAPEKHDHR